MQSPIYIKARAMIFGTFKVKKNENDRRLNSPHDRRLGSLVRGFRIRGAECAGDTTAAAVDELAGVVSEFGVSLGRQLQRRFLGAGEWASAAAFSYEAWFNTSSNPSLLEITADGTHWSVVGSLNTSTFVWTPYVNGSPITSIATLNVGTGLGSGSGNLNLQPAALSTIGGVEAINAVSHEWISYIDTSGVPHLSQPACGDLSNAGSGCSAMIANYLPLAGGTMSGGIAMGSNSITGLSGLTLNNNDYIQWKDTGGTARNVLALDYNNNVALYAPSGGGIGFEVNAGTVALNLD